MRALGVLLMIAGVVSMVFGGIGLAIYYIYDLVMNWEELSRAQVFWHIVWIVLRDILAIGGGAILFVLGGAMADR